jgi:hypothetical protein
MKYVPARLKEGIRLNGVAWQNTGHLIHQQKTDPERKRFSFSLEAIGVEHGVSKGVEYGRKLPALWAGHP